MILEEEVKIEVFCFFFFFDRNGGKKINFYSYDLLVLNKEFRSIPPPPPEVVSLRSHLYLYPCSQHLVISSSQDPGASERFCVSYSTVTT